MPEGGPPVRFPGFDVLSQSRHWDPVTARAVMLRLSPTRQPRFFTSEEAATATALTDLLLDQKEDSRLPVVEMIDQRLADNETDGWHYQDMPTDQEAWRRSLAALDDEARDRAGDGFVASALDLQKSVIQDVQDLGSKPWHGLVARHVWSLWTRYSCTAFYSHPYAWNEIGFPGPAYPRGYKNAGVGKREPFEVSDAVPGDDPVRQAG